MDEKYGVFTLINGKKLTGFFHFVENGIETHKSKDSVDFLFIPFTAIQYIKFSKNINEVNSNESQENNG